jgi:hypothetical protein
MAGIRVYPNYHNYTLDDAAFSELVSLVAERNLILQIALSMEDPRTQYPLMHVPLVDPKPLPELLKRTPNLRLVLLNGSSHIIQTAEIAQADNVYFDIAMMEGIGGIARLIAETSPSRIVFGSHYPLFYFESALLKVREAGLTEGQANAVREGNARALLGPRA